MNIGEKTRIEGLKNTRCTVGHINHCLNAKDMHEVKYDYLGARVTRGKVLLHTKNGDFTAQFRAEGGWLEYLLFE